MTCGEEYPELCDVEGREDGSFMDFYARSWTSVGKMEFIIIFAKHKNVRIRK